MQATGELDPQHAISWVLVSLNLAGLIWGAATIRASTRAGMKQLGDAVNRLEGQLERAIDRWEQTTDHTAGKLNNHETRITVLEVVRKEEEP